jgi:hypothetical protein
MWNVQVNLTILKAPLCAIRLAEQMFQKDLLVGEKKVIQ